MTIMIAVPAYGGSVRRECLTSVAQLAWTFPGGQLATIDRNDISVVRDVLAAEFLASKNSHLLFIDADMECSPQTVIKMVKMDKPLIGSIYRKRTTRELLFAVNGEPRNIDTTTGLCEVDGIGMGLCLIQRSVFTRLIETGKIATFKRGLHKLPPNSVHRFFQQIAPSDDADELSEDNSFCYRWRTFCGGTVHALAGENIGHIGDFNYRRNYLEFLKTRPGQLPTPSPDQK
jgi:hypothetical protein